MLHTCMELLELPDEDAKEYEMEIIIKSQENGWETERRLELPEDEGLVKTILRSVKRRTNSSPSGGGGG